MDEFLDEFPAEFVLSDDEFVSPYRDPTYPAPIGSVAKARKEVSAFIDAWASTHSRPDASVFLLKAGVGVGKSHAAREVAVDLIGKSVRGDTCGVLAVPRHALGDEQGRDFEIKGAEHGLTAHVYRGREANDPDAPGERMCRRWEEAGKIGAAGGDANSLCSQGRGDERVQCPFFGVCGVQRQRQVKADLHIVPHPLMFHAKPDFMPDVSWVIIDEDITQAALNGFDKLHPVRLSIDEALAGRLIPVGEDDGGVDYSASDTYETARTRLSAVLDGEQITREALENAGIDAEMAREARKLVFRCKKTPNISPTMTADETMPELDEAVRVNRPIMRLANLWKMIAETLESGADAVPGVRVETVPATEKTESYRAIRLRWRQGIHESWKAPTLLMDATSNAEIVKPLFPSIDAVLDAQPSWPNARIRQVLWSASATHLIPKKDGEKEDSNRAATAKLNNIERVRQIIEVRAAEFRGKGAVVDGSPIDVLVICQMGLEAQLRARGVPACVEVAHFNAISGADRWKGVACLIVIGRTLPNAAEVEMAAEVLGGRPVDRIEGKYPKQQGAFRMRGTDEGRPFKTDQHPDPLAEALRWQVCEGQLVQAVGRARAVNRTEANPVQIDIINTVILPVEFDEVVEWGDALPHPVALMAARGVVLESGRDLAVFAVGVCPDVWETTKAFECWKARAGFKPSNVNNKLYIDVRGFENWPLYRAHRDGARYAQTLRIDPVSHPDPRAAAEAIAGKLKSFERIPEPTSTITPVEPDTIPETKAAAVEGIDLTGALARLAALSARLEDANPMHRASNALERLSERLEAAKPSAEILALGALPGFGPTKADNTPPMIGNGGCSDEPEEAYVPFDYGPADRSFERYRQIPDLLRRPIPGTDLEEIVV
jgi:putative DNA primase/helicase